mmetsp:Transcript_32467/g.80770  ORF Transcript_32467/g.80770 Transcript_32467/m.80770 type:complete len:208 (-) Transcript_32467:3199-3822(-)
MNTSIAESPEKPKSASTKKTAPIRFCNPDTSLPKPWKRPPTAVADATATKRCSRNSEGWRTTETAALQKSERSSTRSRAQPPCLAARVAGCPRFAARAKPTRASYASGSMGTHVVCWPSLAETTRISSSAASTSSKWSARLKPDAQGTPACSHTLASWLVGAARTSSPPRMRARRSSPRKARLLGWWMERMMIRPRRASARRVRTME